ncbi:MAG: alpha-L-rhamnosidase, partial [Bryocella sp.]
MTGVARTFLCAVSALSLSAVCVAAPVHLRVDARVNPLGIDSATPHFSWRSNSVERNWKQSAYEIEVASSAAKLAAGKADVWDSGKIAAGDSVDLAYAGPALKSQTRYVWRVKVWDAKGGVSTSSERSWWEMGLLAPSDWTAKWIHHIDPSDQLALRHMNWIWLPKVDWQHVPEKTVAEFRYELPLTAKPMEATLHILNGQKYIVTVNGVESGHKNGWLTFD